MSAAPVLLLALIAATAAESAYDTAERGAIRSDADWQV